MIVKCKLGHEFEDSIWWECPFCQFMHNHPELNVDALDIFGGRI